MIDLLAEAMAKESTGFLVDGFPATVEQVFTSISCFCILYFVFRIYPQQLNRYFFNTSFHQVPDIKSTDRRLIQAQLFEKTVGAPVKIIVFEMKDELMRVRLEGRGNFDDRKDAIKKRIDNYNEGTKPVIKAYSNLVKSVSGMCQ